MSKRKKKHDDDHMGEDWLLPYADILTLLLALFIVLFASSSVNEQKLQDLSKVFNNIFTSGTGVMDYSKPTSQGTVDTDELTSVDNQGVSKQPNQDNQSATDSDKSESDDLKQQQQQEREELKEVQEKINSYIEKNKLNGKFVTKLTDEGLLLTIRDNVFFESGQATIKDEHYKTAKEVAGLLVMDPPRNIIISGHTDNVPIRNSSFQSNWELSVTRALSFMKILLENKELSPRYFSVKGYGEYKPVASNNTEAGKAKNRRVEVLIQPRVKMSK